jgi:hypothetical protein
MRQDVADIGTATHLSRSLRRAGYRQPSEQAALAESVEAGQRPAVSKWPPSVLLICNILI